MKRLFLYEFENKKATSCGLSCPIRRHPGKKNAHNFFKTKFVLIILLTVLSGCLNQPRDLEHEAPNQELKPFEQNEREEQNDHQVLFNQSTFRGVGNEVGRYIVEFMTDQLKYIDFGTHQEIILTNRPDCVANHTCGLETSSSPILLGLDETQLYILTQGASDGMVIDESGTNTQLAPALYQMNLDGTGLKQIYEFESGHILNSNNAFLNHNDLYYGLRTNDCEQLDEMGSSCFAGSGSLVRSNLSTGENTEIASAEEAGFDIVGVYDSKLIFTKTTSFQDKDNLYHQDFAQYQKLMDQQTVTVYAYDLTTQATEILLELPLAGNKWSYTFMIYENQLLYTYLNSEAIEFLNLDTLETGILIEGISPVFLSDGSYHHYVFSQIDDHYLQAVNLKTGNRIKIPKDEDQSLAILGEFESNLLVEVMQLADDSEYDDDSKLIIDSYFALITLEDFLAGNFQFEKINTLN